MQWLPYIGIDTAILPHQRWVPHLLTRGFAPHCVCSWLRWQLCRLAPSENVPGIGTSWCQLGISDVRAEPGSRPYSHLFFTITRALKIVSRNEIACSSKSRCSVVVVFKAEAIKLNPTLMFHDLRFSLVNAEWQWSQVNSLSVKFPPFKIFWFYWSIYCFPPKNLNSSLFVIDIDDWRFVWNMFSDKVNQYICMNNINLIYKYISREY